MNKNGIKPDALKPEDENVKESSPFGDLLSQDSISRFDKKKKKKKKKSSSSADKSASVEKQNRQDRDNGGNAAEAVSPEGNDNGIQRRPDRKQRAPKPKRQQSEPPQDKSEQQPRGEKRQRRDRSQKPVKTFKPRQSREGDTAHNNDGQGKQNNAKD